MGSGGHVVEYWTINRGDGGSIPPNTVSKQFRPHHICLCLSLLSGVWEVKYPTQEPVVDSLILEKDNSCVSPSLGCLEETA